jgi:anti-sigma regulatory factor (Ser/Thr protein kinase)
MQMPTARSSTHAHAVSFYDDDSELADVVGRFVAEGLLTHEPVVVIATAPHRESVDEFLTDWGIDPARARADGSYYTLDAAETLSALMLDGVPDAVRFRAHIGRLLDHARAGGTTVRAFGEMVALMWERGDVPGAITLESLWNDLAGHQDFCLHCAYPTFALDPAELDHVSRVCTLHSAVLPPRSYGSSTGPTTDRGILRSSEVFVPAPGAVTAARRFVSHLLETWGHPDLVWDAAVVTSELATNAVRHASSPFRVSVDRARGGVRIGIEDIGPGRPQLRTATPEDVGGRGIGIVEELSDRWGVDELRPGKVTWAELDRAADSAR